jgi:microcystin-dependent protein
MSKTTNVSNSHFFWPDLQRRLNRFDRPEIFTLGDHFVVRKIDGRLTMTGGDIRIQSIDGETNKIFVSNIDDEEEGSDKIDINIETNVQSTFYVRESASALQDAIAVTYNDIDYPSTMPIIDFRGVTQMHDLQSNDVLFKVKSYIEDGEGSEESEIVAYTNMYFKYNNEEDSEIKTLSINCGTGDMLIGDYTSTTTNLEGGGNINAIGNINAYQLYQSRTSNATLGVPYILVPAGTIILFSATSPPSGYLTCNGASINRVTYSVLFSVVGTTYGTGDDEEFNTTFNLPDLRGRTAIGINPTEFSGISERLISASGGAETHTLTVNEMPSHNHTLNTEISGWSNSAYSVAGAPDRPDRGTNSLTTSNTGGGQAHNNMQPYIVLNYIIKY